MYGQERRRWVKKCYESMMVQGEWIRFVQFDEEIDFEQLLVEMERKRMDGETFYSRGKRQKMQN